MVIKVEHLLIFVVVIFLLYHLMVNGVGCGCNRGDGFSVGIQDICNENSLYLKLDGCKEIQSLSDCENYYIAGYDDGDRNCVLIKDNGDTKCMTDMKDTCVPRFFPDIIHIHVDVSYKMDGTHLKYLNKTYRLLLDSDIKSNSKDIISLKALKLNNVSLYNAKNPNVLIRIYLQPGYESDQSPIVFDISDSDNSFQIFLTVSHTDYIQKLNSSNYFVDFFNNLSKNWSTQTIRPTYPPLPSPNRDGVNLIKNNIVLS
jgi:hypothetical protein